ncbi:MAG: DUF3592 domain-containing protein [Candidatus Sumerlaeota bacterium]|nr:DUF3592 domain-containing protein [Candidatus Sumerlaeota bacterium]
MPVRTTIPISGGGGGFLGKGCATVFFFVFFAIGAVATSVLIVAGWREGRSYFWPKTDCQILASKVSERLESRGGGEPYAFEVLYSYMSGGQTRQSSVYQLGYQGASQYGDVAALVRQYPAGGTAVCYINPEIPSRAVLRRQGLWFLFFIFIPLIFVAIGGGGIWFTWRPKRAAVSSGAPIISPISQTASIANPRRITGIVCLFFMIVGMAILIPIAIIPCARMLAARSWTETPCKIISSRVTSHSGKGTTYGVDILYSYMVGGLEYRSSRYAFIVGTSSGRAGKQAIVSRYRPDSTALCYVNPNDPYDAVLYRGLSPFMLFALIPLFFVVAGGAGLLVLARKPAAFASASASPAPIADSGMRSFLGGYTPAPSPALGQPVTAGPLVLKPSMGPVVKFIGILIFAGFWNSIISVFVTQMVRSFMRGRPEWFGMIFMIPFLAVGLGLIVAAGYYFLQMFNPRPIVTLLSSPLFPGSPLNIQITFRGAVRGLRKLSVSLEGREEATYQRGTTTVTDKSVFAQFILFESSNSQQIAGARGSAVIPAGTMHSFKSSHNKIVWALRVQGDIPRWPDINEEFPINVMPARIKK